MEQTFDVTALQYPFPFATNPYAAAAESKIGGWIEAYYGFLPEKVKKKYMHTGVGLAAGCMFPRANAEQLTAICRFFLWAFIVDDSFEYAMVEEIRQIRGNALPIMRGHQAKPATALYQQLPLLRRELLSFSSEAWINRFCNSLDGYFDGVEMEIPYRVNMKYPDFETFYAIRERAVNVEPLVNLAEAITGTIIPGAILAHPTLQQLSQLTCRILSWCNDLFSAHLEKGNDVLNLVLMIEHVQNCTLDEAYRKALSIHDGDVASFSALRTNLPDCGLYQEAVVDYVENLALMIHGYLHWTLIYTQRYRSNGHPSRELKEDHMKTAQL
ncbi:hypothetical protein ECE50_026295 [Chitinophaga sp. Mgbs1]|uniref:Terpene synthase n=1 Tax=Chitinophaga solisilvae TaxID=1233460 RepID=A0A433WCT5_9BACT|nr:hypothetical protein [Chitinophaga solisilvae]